MENLSKSGIIGLVGPTNSGKSTLLNTLIGEKVSIVSPKSQTTYHRVCGVRSEAEAQMVFVDTPGFQRFPDRLARMLNKVADRESGGCDLLCWVFDASSNRMRSQFEELRSRIQGSPKGLCLLNKVDQMKDKKRLLPLISEFTEMNLFQEIIPLSALKQDGVEIVLDQVRKRLGPGPRYFPEDSITDRSSQFLVTEFIREAVYLNTHEEVPYSVRVEVEKWEEESGKVPVIYAIIHVETDGQKGILIGKGAVRLKAIGVRARREVESLLGRKVCLKLHVHVDDEWKSSPRRVKEYLELA